MKGKGRRATAIMDAEPRPLTGETMTPEFPSARAGKHAPWFARPLWGVCLLVVLAGLAAACASRNDVPVGEQRAQSLNREIMCPICPGESLDQSQHILAVQMRGIVDEKLAEGWSDEEIRDFFVERYGASVLLEPSRRGFTILVWIIPPLGGVAAVAGLFLVLRSMSRPRPRDPGSSRPDRLSGDERTRYFERIEAALGESGTREGG